MSRDCLYTGGRELAEAVRKLYAGGQTDYFLEPVVLVDKLSRPIGRIEDGDAVIFCCRRGEREIQLTEAFVEQGTGNFPRPDFTDLKFVILTLYHEKFKDLPVAFAPSKLTGTLSETISMHGLTQLHISESEKYSHITFFINGGENRAFPGEVDIRIPSPRGIPFDRIPELSLPQVVDQLVDCLDEGYDFIVTNFANGDVIGHTASREAKVKCAELLDSYLKTAVQAALNSNYCVIITADHGNLEEMITHEGKPHVSHTANPVPFLVVTPSDNSSLRLKEGILADISPTILSILRIPTPTPMEGINLIEPGQQLGSKKVLLIILDGWGIGQNNETNPIFLANTPYWDGLLRNYPFTKLHAAGEAVGLQAGKTGNSEAGHMNIGAGRVILQDDVRLESALLDGSFYRNAIFQDTIDRVKLKHTKLHLIGLLSERSSHGSIDYPLALLRMAKDKGLEDVYLHLIFDGRSTAPGSAPELLLELDKKITEIGTGKIVTGMGRGIALDRDGNYQKTQCAYEALVYGVGKQHIVDWDLYQLRKAALFL